MVNSKDFAERLNKIIGFYELTAASFADKIDVGRSSISHILSGRNKPSLEFVMKIISAFPEVELYWLLNGKGSFPKIENQSPPTRFSEIKNPEQQSDLFSDNQKQISTVDTKPDLLEKKKIQRVVIFYNDGTFEAYEENR